MSDQANVIQALQRGTALQRAGKLAEAEALYRGVLKVAPRHFDALHLTGLVCAQRGDMAEAARLFAAAVAVHDKIAAVFVNLGVALRASGRSAEAVAAYDRALALDKGDAGTFYNKANALKDLGRTNEALENFARALSLDPRHANVRYNRGILFQTLGRSAEALADFDAAVMLQPGYAEAHYNRGIALRDLRRLPEAIVAYERAIALKPTHADAFINRGNALKELGRQEEALASYDRAIALSGGDAGVFQNRGILLRDMRRHEEARDSLAQSLQRDPNNGEALSHSFLLAGEMCDWATREAARERLVAFAQHGGEVPPFAVLIAQDDQKLQAEASKRYAAKEFLNLPAVQKSAATSGEKVKIAYISADYRTHPTAFLMADLLERHDRSRFEIHGVSLVRGDNSATRSRMEKAFDKFFNVSSLTDEAAAALMARNGVSIAVDLGGYTQHARPGIIARRPAPVAVNYLGFPGTFGAPYIDYILADACVIPEENKALFSEKVVWLPDTYQPPDATRVFAPTRPTRAEAGLPETGFVFCCFNNNFKMSPALFDVWMRLLRDNPASVLWLFASNAFARANLAREAEARGVSPERLIFAGHVAHEEHLARLTLADLFLDTLPYNAHTTASDALWAGVPVLTCRGQAFPARVAASLVAAANMPELITHNLGDYEDMAKRLARDPEALKDLKRRLTEARTSAPLFDGERYRCHVEAAYLTMQERAVSGLAPESFAVTSV